MSSQDQQDPERLDEALRESEARLRSLFDQSLAGVYRSTLQGEVLECNAALARIFGYESPAALRAVPATDLYRDAADRSRHVGQLRSSGALHSGELCMRRRDGSPVWVVYSERLHRDADGRELIEGTLIDVTARRQAESALLLSSRLAAVGTLAAGVAHGINNPLSAVQANVRFAREALSGLAAGGGEEAPPEVQEAREALADAAQGVERIREVVKQLRLFAGESPAPEGPVDLRQVLDTSLRLVAGALRPRDVVERHELDVPPVAAAAAQLGQAVYQVLLNAAQALRARGAPAGRLRVEVAPAGADRVLLAIVDDGCGMGPDVSARAFDPFFSGQAGGEGPGIGLTLTRAYVGSIGGEVTLESLEGQGTTVRLLLPVHRPAAPAA